MTQFQVSTDELGHTSASVLGALAEFDLQLASVSATVDAVTAGSWEGGAADAFVAAWQGWLAGAEITRASLVLIATTLASAERHYEATESAVAQQSRSSLGAPA